MKGGDMERSNAMTIGQLSRRTGVPIKVLRDYETSSYPGPEFSSATVSYESSKKL